MRVLVEFSDTTSYIHRLTNTLDYQTIDVDALLDYICNVYMFGDKCVEKMIMDCVEGISSVGDSYEDKQTFEKLVSDINNLILSIFKKLDELKLSLTMPECFTTIKIVKQWRNLYVFEFT